ncbi:hypothetical protein EDB84DRAFT_1441957 [Lactarius hengduanensis]|nr:hypothetical protein EDB84DRAFT_1441957 [Lactarius hengduanensis]
MALTRCSRRHHPSTTPTAYASDTTPSVGVGAALPPRLSPPRASPAQEAHPVPHPQASKVLAAGELLHDTTTPREGPIATRKPHHDTTPPRAMPPQPNGRCHDVARKARRNAMRSRHVSRTTTPPRPARCHPSPTGDATTSRAKGPSQHHAIAACKPHHDTTPPRAMPPQPNGRCHDVARKARRNAMRSRHVSRTTTPPRPARCHPSPTGDATTSHAKGPSQHHAIAACKPHHDTTPPCAMPPQPNRRCHDVARERPVATPCDRSMQATPRHHPAPHDANGQAAPRCHDAA